MERSDSLERAFRRALPIAVLAVAALTPQPARAEAAIESQVMSKIRAYRGSGIVVHSGLLAAARNHSRGMATRGGLDHNDADARVQNAAPDPVEGNGAPDDGFGVAAWCENVTYVMSHPEHEVAERVFNAWEGSGAHGRCMKEKHRNVGAVGIYYDGQSWWATFIAQVDNTPPGGAPPAPPEQKEEPAPVAKPAASTAPAAEPAQQPVSGQRSEPAGLLDDAANEPVANTSGDRVAEGETAPGERSAADEAERSEPAAAANILRRPESRPRAQAIPRADSAAAPTYGWQEVAAVAALLALATPLLARLRERPSEMERRDRIPLTQIEPVRPCALSAGIERYMVAARVPSDLREMVVQPLPVPT